MNQNERNEKSRLLNIRGCQNVLVYNVRTTLTKKEDSLMLTTFSGLDKTGEVQTDKIPTKKGMYVYINNMEYFDEQDSDENLLVDNEEAVNYAETMNFYESDDDDFNCLEQFENEQVI